MAEENLQMYPINEDTGEIDTTTKLFPITKESNIIDDAGNVVQFQHKLNFANGLKNTNGTIELVMSVVLNAVFPVGSIYCSTSNKTPYELGFPGTWEQIKGKFLAAAGTANDAEGKSITFTLGQTGGYSTAHVVSHTHNIQGSGQLTTGNDEANGTCDFLDTQTGTPHPIMWNGQGVFTGSGYESTDTPGDSIQYKGTANQRRVLKFHYEHTHTLASHTHTADAPSGAINATNAYNIPPYLAVNMWKRTA